MGCRMKYKVISLEEFDKDFSKLDRWHDSVFHNPQIVYPHKNSKKNLLYGGPKVIT